MGIVRLGDASTWKTTESLAQVTSAPATAAAAAAAPAGPSGGGSATNGRLVRIPSGPAAAAPLPAPPKRVMAHAGGRMTIRYPDGYDPQTRQFVAQPQPAAAGAPADGADAGGESEKRRKRMERFGVAAGGGGAAGGGPAGLEGGHPDDDDDGEYAKRYTQAQAVQARLRAEFAARKRAAAALEPAQGRRGGRVEKKKAQQQQKPRAGVQHGHAPGAHKAGVLARLSLPDGAAGPSPGELRDQLQARRKGLHS